MNTILLDTKFFTGGNATFTVESVTGEYFTFKVRQPKPDMPHFASLLRGPNNETDYSYVGIMCPQTGSVRLTAKSKVTEDAKSVKVLRWALKHAFGDKTLPDGYKVRHEGKCGCCGRKLTVPESLDRGIGPECWAKLGGV